MVTKTSWLKQGRLEMVRAPERTRARRKSRAPKTCCSNSGQHNAQKCLKTDDAAAKTGPRQAQTRQDRPKKGPRQAKTDPRQAKTGPRRAQDRPRQAKTGPDRSKTGLRQAKTGPQSRFGTILAPSECLKTTVFIVGSPYERDFNAKRVEEAPESEKRANMAPT